MILPRRTTALACLFAVASCLAQELEPPEDPYADLPPKRAALERMLSERGAPEIFEAATKKAREQGVGEQPILEATFLYYVDRHEDDKVAALMPEFLKRKDSFKLEESEIFAVREDWLAVVEYVQAIAALKKNDRVGFKKHITEAFWLSPKQGSAFAPHIDRMRLDEAMRDVKIDSSVAITQMFAEGKLELSSLLKDRKALLLHFWSPWSRECEESMADFKVTALELQKNGVAVASLLSESTIEALGDAKTIVKELGTPPPGAWLIDHEKDSLHRMLRIQSVPSMVLVSPDGRVIFNGHPSEDRLWAALKAIAPEIRRPAVKEE
jgi:hypothetical protein